MNSTKYLFDTNCFLDASLRYYQNDYFPDFWKWLQTLFKKEVITTTKKVKQELTKKEDFVSTFIKDIPPKYFIDDTKYLSAYEEIINKAYSMDFNPKAKDEFAKEDKADAWIVAISKHCNCTVVSNEVPDDNEKRNIKIPRMCKELNITCINIFDFIKEQKIKFHIDKCQLKI